MSSNASARRAAIRLQSSSSEGSTVVSSEAGVSVKRSAPGRCYNFPTCLTKQPEHSFTQVASRLVFSLFCALSGCRILNRAGAVIAPHLHPLPSGERRQTSVVNGSDERAVQRSRKSKNNCGEDAPIQTG